MTTDWDAIVIGAGPAGSVAARQLALGGRRVLLLDKKRFPRRKVCGACLNHSAVTLLEQIGLGDALRDGGTDLTRLELRAASRRLSLPLPNGRAISRAMLDQNLVDAAIRAGVSFQDGVSAIVGEPHADGRTVEWKIMTDGRGGPAAFRCNGPPDSAKPDRRAEGVSPPVVEKVCDLEVTGGRTPLARQELRTKVVLAADGLGHSSLCGVCEIRDWTARSSRIGAGCEVTEFPADYVPSVIHMAVGRGGYVGLVRVEGGALNIAAAFDARLIREFGGPAQAAANVLAEAGFPAIPMMAEAEWLGTPTLTRSTTPVATQRLFVLGDASGYVEPFTGEGMGWALASAVALAPIADAACDSWQPSLAEAWSREHSRLVRSRQRTCRMLAALLKSPTCVRLAMFLLPKMPKLLQPIVRGVSLPVPQSLAITRCG